MTIGNDEGEYSGSYETGKVIGQGTFGQVALSRRKVDGLETITKIIRNSDVLAECWRKCERRRKMVPMEIHLLERLSHPNIIKMVDVFESPMNYYLITERRPHGMDLFHFIERRPPMTEALASYIFRQVDQTIVLLSTRVQVVFAVSHLNSLSIIHRDLKDENVIIDCNLHCVLIDFGSAAYFGEGIVFSSFCGTPCNESPEIVRGELYQGPEQEIWSLGVLLFTLVHFDYPFESEGDILNGNLRLSANLSDGLVEIIRGCLNPYLRFRLTIEALSKHPWMTFDVSPSSLVNQLNTSIESEEEHETSLPENTFLTSFLAQIEI